MALTVCCAVSMAPVLGCGTPSETIFTWSTHPIYPVKVYANGNLGLLQPTFDSTYLVIAFRYLSGKSLSKSEAAAADEMLEHRITLQDTGCDDIDASAWVAARKSAVGGADVSVESFGTVAGANICNIQTNAFVAAANTLQSLSTKFGAKSEAVKEWVAAQDMVFSNDGSKPSIPEPLSGGNKLLQQQRSYQIAAADFYAMQYDDASKQFSKIGQDKDSPWSKLARYLEMRSLIRQASFAKDPFDKDLMQEAQKRLSVLLKDPSLQDIHDDLADLADLVANRLESSSKALAKQREHHLALGVMKNLTDRGLMDYTDAFDRMTGSDDAADTGKTPKALLNGVEEITAWIDVYQSTLGMSKRQALARWKSSKSMPWLVAALSKASAADQDAKALIDEGLKVAPSSCAFITVSYDTARLLMERKQTDQARATIDRALAQKNLDDSSRNRLTVLRLQLARNVADFARDSLAKNVGTACNGDQSNEDQSKQKPELTDFARQIYDDDIPLSVFKALAECKEYDKEIRMALSKMGFCRAILLGNASVAKALANDLVALGDDKDGLFKSYLQAVGVPNKKFAAVFILLCDEGFAPSNSRASSWWWGFYQAPDAALDPDYPVKKSFKSAPPPFLTPADRAAAHAELAKLRKIPAAPAYLAGLAVAWAKSHPKDVRVPQALYQAVRCTRYGDRDDESAKYSKEAFMILHHNFAKNDWTAETPYYY